MRIPCGACAPSSPARVATVPAARLAAIRGPHPTFDAACSEAAQCRALDIQPTLAAGAPIRELRIVAVSHEDNPGDCAIVLHTDAGWFLATQDGDPASCSDPSYVEVATATAEREDLLAVLEVAVDHHTKDGDDSGEHIWTSVCGVGSAGPWCSSHLTLACDPFVCPSDTARWERTIDLTTAGTLTVTTTSPSETARRETGTFALPR